MVSREAGMLLCFRCFNRIPLINFIEFRDDEIPITLLCQCDDVNEVFSLSKLKEMMEENRKINSQPCELIENYCFNHRELSIEFHCLNCNTAICFKCIKQHKRHHLLSLEELWDETKRELQYPQLTPNEQEKRLKSIVSDNQQLFADLLSFTNSLYHQFFIGNELKFNYSSIRNIIYFESCIFQMYLPQTYPKEEVQEGHPEKKKAKTKATVRKNFFKGTKLKHNSSLTILLNAHLLLFYYEEQNTIELFDLRTIHQVLSFPSPSPLRITYVFSDRHSLFAVTDLGGTIYLYNQSLFPEIEPKAFKGHTKAIISLLFINQSEMITCSRDRTLRGWDITSGNTLHKQDSNCYYMAFLLSIGIISVSYNNVIMILGNTSNKAPNTTIKELIGHKESVNKVIELRNSKQIVSCSYDRTIRVWNSQLCLCEGILKEHSKTVNDILELIDGRLASASDDHSIKIWDIDYRICTLTIIVHSTSVLSIGQLYNATLLSVSSSNDIVICD